jgi:hypothetical protein
MNPVDGVLPSEEMHMDVTYQPPKAFRHSLDHLHEIVMKEAGSDDFGGTDYLPGLKVLLHSMDYDPHFSETGRRGAWGEVIGVLRARAYAIKSMKRERGFELQHGVDPVVITGVPRTGTTALHRLMSLDERFQGLQRWLLDYPMPRPSIESWHSYPEFRRSAATLDALHMAAPQRRAAHHVAANEVHECCNLLRQSFVSNVWTCYWSSATYDAWWQCQSEWPAYQHYYRCVQLIGSTTSHKRWLLKNPGHIENLDLLFAVFPAARVIQTHRDPAKALPSLASLLMKRHPVFERDRTEKRRENILAREVAKWSNAVRKAEKIRQQYPEKVIDVIHADFQRQPMHVIERIYAFIGMDIPNHIRSTMIQRTNEKPELQHGVHNYNIADYGMTEEEVRAPFSDYVKRYGLMQ